MPRHWLPKKRASTATSQAFILRISAGTIGVHKNDLNIQQFKYLYLSLKSGYILFSTSARRIMRKCSRRSPAKPLNSSSSVTKGTLPGPGSSNKGFEASVRQTARTFRYERTSIIVSEQFPNQKRKKRERRERHPMFIKLYVYNQQMV